MLVHPSSEACDLLWIYFMCCIALVRCVLVLWCGSAGVVWYAYAGCRLKLCFSLHKGTIPPQPNHTLTPTHIEPEQYNTWNNSTISRKLLKMDVLTFEICWVVNSEIINQVASSWSIFIQKLFVREFISRNLIGDLKTEIFVFPSDIIYRKDFIFFPQSVAAL